MIFLITSMDPAVYTEAEYNVALVMVQALIKPECTQVTCKI